MGVLVDQMESPMALKPINLEAALPSTIAAPYECVLPLRQWRDTYLVWQSPTADAPEHLSRVVLDLDQYLPTDGGENNRQFTLPVSGVHSWISDALPARTGDPPQAPYNPNAFDPYSRISCLLVSKTDGRCVPLKKLVGQNVRAFDLVAAANGLDVSGEPYERREKWTEEGWQDNVDGRVTWAFSARRYDFGAAFGACAARSRSFPRVLASFFLYPPELAGGRELLVLRLIHNAGYGDQFTGSVLDLSEQEKLLTVLPWE